MNRDACRDSELPSMPAIEAVGLTKKFGALTAVDSVTFDVEEGEVFGSLGPNGAGKTTTRRGLSPPEKYQPVQRQDLRAYPIGPFRKPNLTVDVTNLVAIPSTSTLPQ